MLLVFFFFFLMLRRPPRSTRTDTLFPYTTLFRSLDRLRVAILSIALDIRVDLSALQHRTTSTLNFPFGAVLDRRRRQFLGAIGINRNNFRLRRSISGSRFHGIVAGKLNAARRDRRFRFIFRGQIPGSFAVLTHPKSPAAPSNGDAQPEERRVGKECVSPCRTRG